MCRLIVIFQNWEQTTAARCRPPSRLNWSHDCITGDRQDDTWLLLLMPGFHEWGHLFCEHVGLSPSTYEWMFGGPGFPFRYANVIMRVNQHALFFVTFLISQHKSNLTSTHRGREGEHRWRTHCDTVSVCFNHSDKTIRSKNKEINEALNRTA